jgi:hypothetical protein
VFHPFSQTTAFMQYSALRGTLLRITLTLLISFLPMPVTISLYLHIMISMIVAFSICFMWSCVQRLQVILALILQSLPFFVISTELIQCQKYDILSLVVLGPIDLTKSANKSLGAKTSHISRKFLDCINSACGRIELHWVGRRLQKKAK